MNKIIKEFREKFKIDICVGTPEAKRDYCLLEIEEFILKALKTQKKEIISKFEKMARKDIPTSPLDKKIIIKRLKEL